MTDATDPDAQDQWQGRPAAGKRALGKGLGALIGESRAALGRTGAAPTLSEGRLRELPLADISVNRRQPRRTFSDDELQELAASIAALGVVQPVVVRPLHAEGQAAEGVPAPTGRPLRAHRRRAAPAGREARRPRVHTRTGATRR